MAENKNQEIRENSVVITARRALGLSKTYIFSAIFITVLRLTIINPTFWGTIGQMVANVSSTELSLLSIVFDVLPVIMLITPIVILFVYDKNNGVLEYLLSLGMTQRDIYLRYLYASLLIACVYLIIFAIADTLYLYVSSGISSMVTQLPILAIGVIIAFSIVAFVITMMMAFSVLQKSRAGGNQPLAITLGLVGIIPDYFIPFVFPFSTAV
ncbi:MAG: hypothetical protein QXW29_05080, partial [Thermoplasmatales archaeon]